MYCRAKLELNYAKRKGFVRGARREEIKLAS